MDPVRGRFMPPLSRAGRLRRADMRAVWDARRVDGCHQLRVDVVTDGLSAIRHSEELGYPSQALPIAARRACIVPLGSTGSIAEFRNEDAFTRIVEVSARLGFEGGFAIHPSQVAALGHQQG
jgi:citrate lyase beta subunit